MLQMQNILIKGHETKGHSRKMCMKAQKGRVYSSNPFEISALGGTGRLAPRPGRFTPQTLRNGPVWSGAENLASTSIRTPDRQPVASHYAYMKHPLIMNKVKQLDI